MTRRTVFKFVANLFVLTSVASGQNRTDQNEARGYLVSLIKVIANPKEFDDKRLRIVGYLANAGVDQTLGVYLSIDDGERFVLPNSITIGADPSAFRHLTGQYVIFSGVYHAPDPRSEANGYFDQILNMLPLTNGK